MNQRIIPLELFVYIHEILQFTYLAETASELSNTLVLKGLNYGIEPEETKVFLLLLLFYVLFLIVK